MFGKQWLVQIALVTLIATAVSVLIIYGAYINRESTSVASSVLSVVAEGQYLVKTPPTIELPDPTRMYSASLLAAWHESAVPSSLGELPCVFMIEGSSLRAISTRGTALFSKKLAERFGLAEGDMVFFRQAGKDIKLSAIIYSDTEITFGYNFGDRVLVFTDDPPAPTRFLYRHTSGNANSVRLQLRGLHPSGEIQDSSFAHSSGIELVRNTYAGMARAKFSLVVFITVAFLTAKILSFMDNRRTLGILKSMGLRNNQVAVVIGAESVIAPILGVVCGVLLAKGLFIVFAQQSLRLVFTTELAFWSIVTLFPAIAFGVYVPSRLSGLATTLELLFHRSIPLVYEKVKSVGRRIPAVDAYVAQGVHFLKLDMVEGEFNGIIFRHLGEEVKEGEIIAHSTSWWGLKVKQYIAPVAGVIVYFQKDTGYIGIDPGGGAIDGLWQVHEGVL